VSRLALGLALACLAAALPARAQDPNSVPPVVAPTAPPPAPGEQRLSLREVTLMALANNLSIEIQRATPKIADTVVVQAQGAFDPFAFSEFEFEHRETPVASTVLAAFGLQGVIDEDEWDGGGGIAGATPLGLEYSSAYNFRRLDSNTPGEALERSYRPVWETGLVLPLLKDLIYNESNVRVRRSRIARDISLEDFRRELTNELTVVESTYWRLAAERANAGVAQKSLKTAQDLLEQTRVQYEVGVVSRVRVTEADAGVAEREVNLIRAENFVGDAQDELLNRILAPEAREYAITHIVTEDPTFVEYTVDESEALEKAMVQRPELAVARKAVEDAELQLAYAKNQRLPSLDVSASYMMSGLSGPQKIPPGTPINARGIPVPPGDPTQVGVQPDLGFDPDSVDAHEDFFRDSGAHGWSAGARVEIPIGNRTARYQVSQREIELRRANTALKRTEQFVILEVRRAARTLRSAIEALQASERRRAAQEETLRAEQERLRLGDSTPFNVLEREEDLAEAERQVVAALQIYRVSVAELQRSQGTLLESYGIVVDQALE
jgi:outer membrane protein TolC